MNSIDISDLAFSLGNMPVINEILSSTSETIPEFINDTIPDFVNDTIPDFLNDTINTNIVHDISDTYNVFFLYLGICLIIILIIGFFTYNYFINKNRHVRFQDNVENYYQRPSNNQRSDF